MESTRIRWPERGRLDASTGAELRDARRMAGLGIGVAAHRAGIHPGFLSELERGLKRPRAATAERLIRAIPMHPSLVQDLRAAAVAQSAYVPPNDRPPGWQPRVLTGADDGYYSGALTNSSRTQRLHRRTVAESRDGLERVLVAIRDGELTADTAYVARLEGAIAALSALLGEPAG